MDATTMGFYALLRELARAYQYDCSRSCAAMIVCDASDKLPLEQREGFWLAWEQAKREAKSQIEGSRKCA